MGNKHFMGFGFGPIQVGLMLYEAKRSGNFSSYTIAEIDVGLVDTIRKNNNSIHFNIAHADRIEVQTLSDLNILNPRDPDDRKVLAEAINDADELATAIPSVDFYGAGCDSSIAQLIAKNIDTRKPRIIYASENNNYAAEILEREILKHTDHSNLSSCYILDTVIGKMSGVKTSAVDIEELGLTTIVPGMQKAILVESFNRIYVSKPRRPVTRGITVFQEKDDLLPFEEAKLFGHNAIHSMLGYCAAERGLRVMSEIRGDKGLMAMGRKAFLEESGAALIAKHGVSGDTLFTNEGYEQYADDLIDRMTNPFLLDEVSRICRDPRRKLAWGDRLAGTMCVAIQAGISPVLLAHGAAAALRYLVRTEKLPAGQPESLMPDDVRKVLRQLWEDQPGDTMQDQCLDLINNAYFNPVPPQPHHDDMLLSMQR